MGLGVFFVHWWLVGYHTRFRNLYGPFKSDSEHGSGYYGHRALRLTPAGTICCSTHSLGHYPILIRSLGHYPIHTP